jgi:hypothetical protein
VSPMRYELGFYIPEDGILYNVIVPLSKRWCNGRVICRNVNIIPIEAEI